MNKHEQFLQDQIDGELKPGETVRERALVYTGPGFLVQLLSRLTFGLIGILLIHARFRRFYAVATDRRIILVETKNGWISFGKSNEGLHVIGYDQLEDVSVSSFWNNRAVELVRDDGDKAILRANTWFNKISGTRDFCDNLPRIFRTYAEGKEGGDELSVPADLASVFATYSGVSNAIDTGFRWLVRGVVFLGLFLLVASLPVSVWYNSGPVPSDGVKPGDQRLDFHKGGPGESYEEAIYGYEQALTEWRTILKEETSPSWNPVTILWNHFWYNVFLSGYDIRISLDDRDGGFGFHPYFYQSGNIIFVRARSNRDGMNQVLVSNLSPKQVRNRIAPHMEAERTVD